MDRVGEAELASFNLEILVHNEKEVAVEIRDPVLAFGKDRDDIIEIGVEGPVIPGQGIGFKKHYDMRLTVIPGEQSKIFELSGAISKGAEGLMKLPTCDHVDFVATYGNGGMFRHRVASIAVKD